MGAATPWVSSSSVTNSRNTTGSPSVTKYDLARAPAAGAEEQSLDRVLDVRDPGQVTSLPDPGEAAARTSSTIEGSSVVPRRPIRTGAVRRPSRSPPGWRPARPSRRGPWWRCTGPASPGRSGAVSSTFTNRPPRQQGGLRADVDEAAHAGCGAGAQRVCRCRARCRARSPRACPSRREWRRRGSRTRSPRRRRVSASSSSAPRTGSAPCSATASAALSERARARPSGLRHAAAASRPADEPGAAGDEEAGHRRGSVFAAGIAPPPWGQVAGTHHAGKARVVIGCARAATATARPWSAVSAAAPHGHASPGDSARRVGGACRSSRSTLPPEGSSTNHGASCRETDSFHCRSIGNRTWWYCSRPRDGRSPSLRQ